jgi:hypothetical protein
MFSILSKLSLCFTYLLTAAAAAAADADSANAILSACARREPRVATGFYFYFKY